jgi:LAS superfamily LD-carboxypeptidase LdcB
MRKKSVIAIMLIAVIVLATTSCSSGAKTSSSTQDATCDFTSKPGKQQFQNSKQRHYPAPETPIGRR